MTCGACSKNFALTTNRRVTILSALLRSRQTKFKPLKCTAQRVFYHWSSQYVRVTSIRCKCAVLNDYSIIFGYGVWIWDQSIHQYAGYPHSFLLKSLLSVVFSRGAILPNWMWVSRSTKALSKLFQSVVWATKRHVNILLRSKTAIYLCQL